MSLPLDVKVRLVCVECKSEDVVCDAFAQWNPTAQAFEVSSVMDDGHYCNACDKETRIEEVPA